MRRILIAVSLLAITYTSARAQTNASAKATAAINTVSVSCPSASNTTAPNCSTGWTDVMTSSIKTSNIADLFISPSLVTGLYTSTKVQGNGTGATSTAVASATVEVRVLIDGNATLAYPDTTGNGVTFDSRVQTLTANLGYIFTDCLAQGGTGCTLTPEQITLALDTSSAHSYNFIAPNVGVGTHSLKIQARASSKSTGDTGGVAISNALYGLGSVTVEAVRLVNSFSF